MHAEQLLIFFLFSHFPAAFTAVLQKLVMAVPKESQD